MDTVIVLGAGGFLGRYICREFLQQQVRVVGVGRTPVEQEETTCFVQGDLLGLDLADLFAKESPRWVINAAGGSSVGDSFADPWKDWQKTVVVQKRVLDGLRRINNNSFYIFLSSAAVYGEPTQLPILEEVPCRPISPYGMHKWQAELLQEEYSRFFGLRGAVLRIFSAYGDGLKRQVVYELSQKILQAENQLEVFGTGEETRDFIHASDVARAVYCIADAEEPGLINVASGKQICISALAQSLVKQYKPNLSIVFTGKEIDGNPRQWLADVSKLKKIGFCWSKSIMDPGNKTRN